jgi:NAD(P)-dependent dehydrogenase (short-subunit alcohol dehydrogenase family)
LGRATRGYAVLAEEIAEAVRYLASARFVTGHILPVDGGFVTGRARERADRSCA